MNVLIIVNGKSEELQKAIFGKTELKWADGSFHLDKRDSLLFFIEKGELMSAEEGTIAGVLSKYALTTAERLLSSIEDGSCVDEFDIPLKEVEKLTMKQLTAELGRPFKLIR